MTLGRGKSRTHQGKKLPLTGEFKKKTVIHPQDVGPCLKFPDSGVDNEQQGTACDNFLVSPFPFSEGAITKLWKRKTDDHRLQHVRGWQQMIVIKKTLTNFVIYERQLPLPPLKTDNDTGNWYNRNMLQKDKKIPHHNQGARPLGNQGSEGLGSPPWKPRPGGQRSHPTVLWVRNRK